MIKISELITGIIKTFKGEALRSDCGYIEREFPGTRSFVTDTCNRGKKKNTIYLFFDADVTKARSVIKQVKLQTGKSISLTAYILKEFAKNVKKYPIMNSYRFRKNKLHVFNHVDVSIMVEKEVENTLQPIHYILRNAEIKGLETIQSEIKAAQQADYSEMVDEIDQFFFKYLPSFVRNIIWRLSIKKPTIMKDLSGSVGLTNIGMFGEGSIVALPITPMTSTIAIGAIEKRLVLIDDHIENREILHLTLCVDHDIVDGSPMMRFTTDLKNSIENCEDLPNSYKEINQISTNNVLNQNNVLQLLSEI